jgi:hypothetical protein
MSYAEINPQITHWAERHVLKLFAGGGESESRGAYVSSLAGECFQIWIETPADGRVNLHAWCIEGRRDRAPPQDWNVAICDFEAALENAFRTVQEWMKPSERFFPTAGKT